MNICKRTLRTGNNKIEYTHEIKNVKNINVRVTPEKGLYVSSPPDVDIDTIERFLASKLDKIIPALDKINNTGTAAGNSPVKKRTIEIGGRQIEYELTYKKIKNIILSVHVTKGVRVSAPIHASQKDIEKFLRSSEDFIIKSVNKQERQAAFRPKEKQFVSGEYVYFVGTKYDLEVCLAKHCRIEINDGKMIMFVTNTEDYALKKALFESFLKSECSDYVASLCRQLYPRFRKKGIDFPEEIRFRKMISCWGNCRSSKKILTFSTYLIQLPPKCIEAVVCHEFTHFLHQNHSKDFYEQLTQFMPDWRVHDKTMKDMQNEIIFR